MIDLNVWASMYLFSGMPIVLGTLMIVIGRSIAAATPAVAAVPCRQSDVCSY